MTFKKPMLTARPSDGFRKRLLALAEPLDAITLKRAELARYAIPAAREFIAAARRPTPDGRERPALPCADKANELISELSCMGDPVAQMTMSQAASPKGNHPAPGASLMFEDNGFTIDTGLVVLPGLLGTMVGFGDSAYGVLFGKCSTGSRNINIGVMLDNSNRAYWTPRMPGMDTTLDAYFPLVQAMESVHAYRSGQTDFPELTLIEEDGSRDSAIRRGISARDMGLYVRTDEVDTHFLARLMSLGGPDSLKAMLNVMHLHYDYLFTKHCYAPDEVDHFVATLNAMIQDDLVRACMGACGQGGWAPMAAMAYGDTCRALSQLGGSLFVALASGDPAFKEAEDGLVTLGGMLRGVPLGSAEMSLFFIYGMYEGEVRENTARIIAATKDSEVGLPSSLVEELESISKRQFVTRENLPRILEVLRMRDECGDALKPLPPGGAAAVPQDGGGGN